MSDVQSVFTTHAPAPGGHYSQAVAFGHLLFVSGQLPLLGNGSHDANAFFENQCRRALQSLFAILAAGGSSPEQVLKVTAYIVGVENWPSFDRVYAEMFGAHRPARSVVPVPNLHYGYLVEIDAIAALEMK